jgi:hypothetical protein
MPEQLRVIVDMTKQASAVWLKQKLMFTEMAAGC